MKLSGLKPAHGSRKRPKIIGRGIGSGHGKTSTRGTKGQNSRSGAKHPAGWEGGTTPLYRRIPKRGFGNGRFRQTFAVVNLADLNDVASLKDVNPKTLREHRLIRSRMSKVKILGGGDITRALNVSVHAVSESAKTKIEAAGGKVQLITTSAF